MANSVIIWFKRHLPTRESVASNRWLKPFAPHLLKPDLWHLNRRSVPRAVALGLLVGVVVPLAHTFVAAVLAIPTRANIAIAAAATWIISNPATWYPLYTSANKIGNGLLGTHNSNSLNAMRRAESLGFSEWLSWLLNEGKAIALGILVLAIVVAAVGYLASSFLWKFHIARKWRRRHKRAK
jgi:uncharacterized protein